MTNYSETRVLLSNLRSLRVFAREISLESLRDAVEKLNVVLQEKEEEHQEHIKHLEEKERKINEIKAILEEKGLDLNDLMPQNDVSVVKVRKKREPKEPKYRLPSGNTWTGQGRTPKELQVALDNGASLNDFLINK